MTATKQFAMTEAGLVGTGKLMMSVNRPAASVVVVLEAPRQESDTLALDKTGVEAIGEGFEQVSPLEFGKMRAWLMGLKTPFATDATAAKTTTTATIEYLGFPILNVANFSPLFC